MEKKKTKKKYQFLQHSVGNVMEYMAKDCDSNCNSKFPHHIEGINARYTKLKYSNDRYRELA